MSEQFKPGQRVWCRRAPNLPYTVKAVCDDNVWLFGEHDRPNNFIMPLDELVATDPNKPAEPEPQACPFCGSHANELRTPDGGHVVACYSCWHRGPMCPTRLEAIQAWNSIRVEGTQPNPIEHVKNVYHRILDDYKDAPAPEPTPKPCPNCNDEGDPCIITKQGNWFRVACNVCSTSGPETGSEELSVRAWNNLGNFVEEREACANIASREARECQQMSQQPSAVHAALSIAAAIRLRNTYGT